MNTERSNQLLDSIVFDHMAYKCVWLGRMSLTTLGYPFAGSNVGNLPPAQDGERADNQAAGLP